MMEFNIWVEVFLCFCTEIFIKHSGIDLQYKIRRFDKKRHTLASQIYHKLTSKLLYDHGGCTSISENLVTTKQKYCR